MGLYGTIPEELGTLPELMSIDFSTNSLSGTLPKSLVSLEKLQILLVSAYCTYCYHLII